MVSLIDSAAQFSQRLQDLSVSDGLRRSLKQAGLVTYGGMAYAHGQPGQPIDDAAFEQWIFQNVMQNATVADLSNAKRILFESQTLVFAALKESLTVPEPSSTKRIPPMERETRMAQLRNRLQGLLIEGPLEPSHGLLDTCATMQHLNEIRYIPPEKATSRSHEVLHQKSPSKQLDISADQLVIKEHKDTPDMTATSALQVQEAFNRRGIAMVFADLVQHTAYTRYITTLFSHLHREPPAGFSRCTVSQIVSADKAVWQFLLESNLRPKRDELGTLPLDRALQTALESYMVSFLLLPHPVRKESTPSPKKVNKAANSNSGGKGQGNFVKQNWNKPKGGKKGFGKGKFSSRVPASIHKLGGCSHDPDGNPICYPYNCDGCSDAADGARCKRGMHVCAKCFGLHSIVDHDKST